MQRLIWAALTITVLGVLSAFTPTVLTPADELTSSRTVFVVDHGTHSSIAIETGAGEMVRYAYGDLRYYANRDTSLGSGAAALLWPTAATLGRAQLEGPVTKESLEQQLRVVVEIIYELEVETAKAEGVMAGLDELHAQGSEQHIDVPEYGLVFAPHPVDYFWGHNSSSVIAGWLREMGVGVFGWGLTASWRVVDA